ncbi:MAG: transglutaminase-like domain-containing protein [Planctomycetota bacterium]
MRVVALCALSAVLCGCQSIQTGQASGSGRPSDSPTGPAAAATVPHVVTADIQAGIEAYVEEQTRLGDGYFSFQFDGRELRLKLVRVHTEYLANLGPRRHFACVDLATTEGNVYDVDFFMAGDPGAMTVTETTIHKINGQPFYVWKQAPNGVWERETVDDASRMLLGVVEGADRFDFLYQVKLPELTDHARMWIPLPESDSFQTIRTLELETPGTHRVLTDRRYDNKVLFLELAPEDSGKVASLRFEVHRLEKAVYSDGSSSPGDFLSSDQNVPVNDEFRAIAEGVLEGKHGELVRARALYDHTIDRMRYAKFGTDYGKGDAQYACDSGAGNCTDYHSLFIALSRSVGIPARFAIGAAIPSERDDGALSGYHCWAEFYAEGRWWPVDISEADKYTSLSTYYFGHNPANRIEFSRGRDLEVDPSPASGPINFLADPVLEIAGVPIAIKPRLSFTRITLTR